MKKIKQTIHINEKSNSIWILLNMISGLDSGVYDVTITDHEQTRSYDQNNFLWGVIYKGLSDQTGYTQDELHDILRMRFNLKDDNENLLSTSTLTKSEFNNYIDQIINWAISLGISIEKDETI